MRGSQQFLPVSDELLSLYLQWRSLTVDPKNLKSKLSTIRYLHERLGYTWRPVTERFRVHRCLMGLKRLCCTPVQHTLPITPAILARMRRCKTINWENPYMVVIWAAMLVAFFCFLRKDNFTVQKRNAYNYRQHLARGDVRFDATSMQFTFRHSKTNQLGLRVHKTVALAMPGRLLDPYDAVAKVFALSPRASATGPAFRLGVSLGDGSSPHQANGRLDV